MRVLLFLEHDKHGLASGSLTLLFPLPGMLFLQKCTGSLFSAQLSPFLKCLLWPSYFKLYPLASLTSLSYFTFYNSYSKLTYTICLSICFCHLKYNVNSMRKGVCLFGPTRGFLGDSVVGIHLQMQETWVRSLGWEDSLEKEMATHSTIIACEIP